MLGSTLRSLVSCRLFAEKLKHLEFHGDQVECGGGRQDGGIGPEEAAQRCTAVPEEQGVPGQQTGTEIWLANQHRDLTAGHANHVHVSVYNCMNFHIHTAYT